MVMVAEKTGHTGQTEQLVIVSSYPPQLRRRRVDEREVEQAPETGTESLPPAATMPQGGTRARTLDEALAQATQAADPLAWLIAYTVAYPVLSPEDEVRLTQEMRSAPTERARREARDRLTLANLRLVIQLALRYHQVSHVEAPDLVQEGIIGLMRAVEKYDPTKARFATYAMFWVSQRMAQAIANQGATIRLPVHAHDKRRRALRARAAWISRTGEEPTLAQWSAETEIPVADLQILWTSSLRVLSLDQPIDTTEAQGHTFAELTPDPQAEEDLESGAAASGSWIVDIAIYALREDPRRTMRLNVFLLHARDGMSLEAIARRYHVTREAIRQHYERTRTIVEAALLEARSHPAVAATMAETIADWRREVKPRVVRKLGRPAKAKPSSPTAEQTGQKAQAS